jgi:lysozyme
MVPAAFANAIVSLKAHEGFRALVYDDATGKPIGPGSVVVGHPTIGFGWALDKTPMTRAHGAWHLEASLTERVELLHERRPWLAGTNPDVLAVLYELTYNLGVDGLLGFPKLMAAVRTNDRAAAARELLDSDAGRMLPDRYGVLAARLAGTAPT